MEMSFDLLAHQSLRQQNVVSEDYYYVQIRVLAAVLVVMKNVMKRLRNEEDELGPMKRGKTSDYCFVADYVVGYYYSSVFKILYNGMAQGNVFYITRIKLTNLNTIAYAKGPENY